ncbi:MAG: diaminopimelate epimerase [Victivallales bacterium]|nr:diaminopimelate epimerase [Victivallales bacterium]
MTHLRKYHGLGNDYLVLDASELSGRTLPPDSIRLLCAPHYGAGSDGILTGPFLPGSPDYQDITSRAGITTPCLCAFRIWNPDASEAEKSGNGVRIFARYLFDQGLVRKNKEFALATLGGVVRVTILDPDSAIRADMGHARFQSPDFPVEGTPHDALKEHIEVNGRGFRFCAVSVGNPHCVVLGERPTPELAHTYGPCLETHPRFPNRINVQFLEVLGEHDIRIEIWERGAGYTLASGTSSSACAAAAVRLGLCQSPVSVHAPGGVLQVEVAPDWNITLTGPVAPVYDLIWRGKPLF